MALNVRGIANSIIVGVNPNIEATLKHSLGNTVDEAGNQVPQYGTETIIIQPQSLSSTDLAKLNLISRQGQFISVYAHGRISAIRRWNQKGSDQLIFAPYGETELVTWNVDRVMESYRTWVRLLLWRQ